MSKKRGFSVRIFIPEGDPEGLRLIEKSNWNGQGVVFPRTQFLEARKRPELQRAGVYVLWGPDDSSHLPRLYIGEGDVVAHRLEQHYRQKEFWTHAAVFTSKDENLNKAHVQYLEARLIQMASQARRALLDNANNPQRPSLSEPDQADAEAFLADMLLCLPLVGANFFEAAKKEDARSPELFLRAKGIEARGFESTEGFVVLKGSQAVKEEVPSIGSSLKELRRTLLEQKVLHEEADVLILTQNYAFSSPSAAAGVLLGRRANGRIEWKDERGRTLKELQESAINEKQP